MRIKHIPWEVLKTLPTFDYSLGNMAGNMNSYRYQIEYNGYKYRFELIWNIKYTHMWKFIYD